MVPAKSKPKSLLVIILPLGLIIIGCLYFTNLTKALDLLKKNMGPFQVLVILVLSWISISWEVLRLRVYFPPTRYSFSIIKLYHVVMAALTLTYSVPVNLGIPIRVVLMEKLLGISYATGIGIVVFDWFLSYVITGGVALIAIYTLFPLQQTGFLISSMAVVLVLFLVFYLLRSINVSGIKGKGLVGLTKRCAEWLPDKWRPALDLLTLRTILLNCLLFLMGIILAALRLESILLGMGEDLSLLKLAFVACIVYTVSTLSMIPLGFGIKEITLVVLLKQTGIDMDIATTSALIERLVTTGLGFSIGLYSIYHLGIGEILSEQKKNGMSAKTFS